MDVIAQLRQERDRARQVAAEQTRRLQELMLEYVSTIATETANAARLDQMIATLQQGVTPPLRPDRPVHRTGPGVSEVPAGADVNGSGSRRQFQVPPTLGAVARVILEALAKAGEKGLSGREVNEAVDLAGFTRDASEKNKTRLKRKGFVHHDRKSQHWYLAEKTDDQRS